MIPHRFAALTLLVAGLAACSDQPTPDPTSPQIKVLFAAGGPNAACGSTLGKTVADQQTALYSGATLTDAQNRWSLVVHDCKTNLPLAQSEMMDYVQFTIDNAKINGGLSTATAGRTAQHWNSVFAYVAYTQPSADSLSLTLKGGAGVVTNALDSQEVRTKGSYAAITIYKQPAGWGSHLLTIVPRGTETCITGTNLIQRGECFDFSAFPHVATWSPDPLVGICHVEHDLLSPTGSALNAMGHQPPTTTAAQILAPISGYPRFCGDPDPVVFNSDWWNDGLGGIAKRLAYAAQTVLTPRSAYASHSGIGGTGGGISPWAPVDRRIFYATFTSDPVDAFPGTPERGRWDSTLKAPGTILVQNSLGDLTAKPVVLSQAGGNCDKKCGGLQLNGIVAAAQGNGLTASTGIYDVFWEAVEDAPSIKGAPIVIRSTGNPGYEIARVTLKTVQSSNGIYFNADASSVGSWTQHQANSFHLVIDFTTTTPRVSLSINGGLPVVSGRGFVDSRATDIGSIRAEFTGIDSGVFGWDNIIIERRTDGP